MFTVFHWKFLLALTMEMSKSEVRSAIIAALKGNWTTGYNSGNLDIWLDAYCDKPGGIERLRERISRLSTWSLFKAVRFVTADFGVLHDPKEVRPAFIAALKGKWTTGYSIENLDKWLNVYCETPGGFERLQEKCSRMPLGSLFQAIRSMTVGLDVVGSFDPERTQTWMRYEDFHKPLQATHPNLTYLGINPCNKKKIRRIGKMRKPASTEHQAMPRILNRSDKRKDNRRKNIIDNLTTLVDRIVNLHYSTSDETELQVDWSQDGLLLYPIPQTYAMQRVCPNTSGLTQAICRQLATFIEGQEHGENASPATALPRFPAPENLYHENLASRFDLYRANIIPTPNFIVDPITPDTAATGDPWTHTPASATRQQVWDNKNTARVLHTSEASSSCAAAVPSFHSSDPWNTCPPPQIAPRKQVGRFPTALGDAMPKDWDRNGEWIRQKNQARHDAILAASSAAAADDTAVTTPIPKRAQQIGRTSQHVTKAGVPLLKYMCEHCHNTNIYAVEHPKATGAICDACGWIACEYCMQDKGRDCPNKVIPPQLDGSGMPPMPCRPAPHP